MRRFQTRAFPLILAALTALPSALPGAASAQDFPPVDQLPSQPGPPDPLVMFDGQRVTSPEQWRSERRPELIALFQHYMYGTTPPSPNHIEAKIVRVNRQALGGKATKKEVEITFPGAARPISLLVVVPNDGERPAPAFLGLNFCGNHTVMDDPSIAIPQMWVYDNCPGCQDNRATEAGRGGHVGRWPIEQCIDRGYAVATFYTGDIDPDTPQFADGIHPNFYKPGQTEPGKHEWGTIAAWAWGLQRALDYLVTDEAIDSSRIAVMGHSRCGKTALLVGALDDRVALVIPNQAGCGGTSPSRGDVGESVTRINTSFPHWFSDTFPEFNGREDRLPFDQHSLIALVAPRPVLLSNAQEDTWADPEGQFRMLQAADPVYRFLGVEGLKADAMPELGKLVDSRLGYYIRPGEHSVTPEDWKVFMDFADKNLPPASE
ncbi:MAG: acetylxylan esterase [Pirellulales bacterium]